MMTISPVTKQINVLELVFGLEKGGRTQRILNTSWGLRQKGLCVTIGTFTPAPQWVKNQWEGSQDWVLFSKGEGLDFQTSLKIFRFLKENKIDIIHAHCETSALYGGLAAKFARIPIIGTFHRSKLSAFRKSLLRRVGNALLNHKIAVSKNRKTLIVKGLDISPDEISVIHGATDFKTFFPVSDREKQELRKKLGIPADIPVLLSLGHLGPIKGHATTLKAMSSILKAHPRAHLFIGGDGSREEKENLQRIIEKENIQSHVTFLGQVKQPQEWLAACNIFVQPSVEEGFGQVFAEAGAVGRPAIGTKVGGIPEIIIDQQTGFLVPVNDSSTLAQRVSQLLGDLDLAKAIGQKALGRVQTEFGLDRLVNQYYGLIIGLLKRKDV